MMLEDKPESKSFRISVSLDENGVLEFMGIFILDLS